MFTGIVQGQAKVLRFEKKSQAAHLVLELPADLRDKIALGGSIAVNGACLTVTAFEGAQVSFDLIMETLRVTNLGDLQPGSLVNVERAAKFNDEIGGHLLSGHVHTVAEISAIEQPEDNRVLTFKLEPQWQKYILNKGYIGLNGCSLTIAEVLENQFKVYLIPETLRITTFGALQTGARVNIEIDTQTQAVVDTVERVLAQRENA
ncbi:riboflavin synthase subunit alpha [Candidatus Venteria ishoeyi]|uniref:riboflavin synthase subunit alpha n=1 Tax=Candidatus Venteria ishoeyi TaxID=1899563 RepID=UPI0025A5C3DE|nr:riboflavin synthase subunit alpha [Candidatus Venteria ishoeyi]MDM8546173.1 riboflavin synthase subunit alpha [Candidatus Venteria ishoeyi]